MNDYREMALRLIRNRDDLVGWKNSLVETGQLYLAEILYEVQAGIFVTDKELFCLAFYMLHVESIGRD